MITQKFNFYNFFYLKVSLESIESGFWGRPEDMGHTRPSFKITKRNPGSDLAGETAAALAAAFLIVKDSKPEKAK